MVTMEDLNTLYDYLRDKMLVEGSPIDKVRTKIGLIINISNKQELLRNIDETNNVGSE